MSLSLEQVAKRAGVSRSTVSRVINNDPNVSDETRQRVMTIVQDLNYHPNVVARGLAAGRTRVLGLVIPRTVSTLFTDPYFSLLIQGVSAGCNAHDHSVMLWIAEPEYERRTIRQVLHGGLIDGVILASQVLDDPVVDALMKSDLPFILIGRHPDATNVSYVDADNRNGAREMVEYLLRLGYHRPATITGPKNTIVGMDRLEGYREALRVKGLVPDPDLIVEGDFTEMGGYMATQQLLPHNPDAIFVASDTMARGALRALREANRRVPQDVALAGFDDMPFAAHSDPPLTTVRQAIQRAGFTAVETLVDLVTHPGSPTRRIILPTELVIRASACSAS
jgi:LacI family transcriptional regulator